MRTTIQAEEWSSDEATEPEGAQFVASNPYARLDGDLSSGPSSVWQSRGTGTAVLTSSRTVWLEATQATAIADPSLFEDVTEPAARTHAGSDPERTVLFE